MTKVTHTALAHSLTHSLTAAHSQSLTHCRPQSLTHSLTPQHSNAVLPLCLGHYVPNALSSHNDQSHAHRLSSLTHSLWLSGSGSVCVSAACRWEWPPRRRLITVLNQESYAHASTRNTIHTLNQEHVYFSQSGWLTVSGEERARMRVRTPESRRNCWNPTFGFISSHTSQLTTVFLYQDFTHSTHPLALPPTTTALTVHSSHERGRRPLSSAPPPHSFPIVDTHTRRTLVWAMSTCSSS